MFTVNKVWKEDNKRIAIEVYRGLFRKETYEEAANALIERTQFMPFNKRIVSLEQAYQNLRVYNGKNMVRG